MYPLPGGRPRRHRGSLCPAYEEKWPLWLVREASASSAVCTALPQALLPSTSVWLRAYRGLSFLPPALLSPLLTSPPTSHSRRSSGSLDWWGGLPQQGERSRASEERKDFQGDSPGVLQKALARGWKLKPNSDQICEENLIRKDPDDRKDWEQEEKGAAEDEMLGWHHQFDGHEFEQTLRIGDGQGGLVCCSPWGRKESDTIERLNWTELKSLFFN